MTRFDILEGYWLYHAHWHASGWTRRCHAKRPIQEQLHRMGFRPGPLLSLDTADEEAIRVYHALAERWEGVKRHHDEYERLVLGSSPGCADCGLEALASADDDPDRVNAADFPYFGKSPCHLCESRLHGDRHPAHGLLDGEWHHLAICHDCREELAATT